jgi:hypothetical protein
MPSGSFDGLESVLASEGFCVCSTNFRAAAHNSASLSFPTVSFRVFNRLISSEFGARDLAPTTPSALAPVLVSPARGPFSGPTRDDSSSE